MTDMWQFAVLGLAVFLGSLLQAAVGFGFSLVVVPLLLSAGFGAPEAVSASVIAALGQRVFALRHLHRAVDWRTLWPMMLIGMLSLPLGVAALHHVSGMRQSVVRQVIGLCILVLILVQWLGKVEPRDSLAAGWGYLASFFAGLLSGFASIGGPPIVLWILAHRWSTERIRITVSAYTLAFVPLQVVLLGAVFGRTAFVGMGKAVVVMPLTLLGAWVGLRVGARFERPLLRTIVRLVLLVIVLSLIARPFFG